MAESNTITKPPYMQNRELSWLEFNKRVLDQGADATVPLLERLNFISIFWSNLQEFFMVRVGSLTDLALVKKSIIDPKSGMTPSEQLEAIYKRCHELYPYYQSTYETLRTQLADEGIVQLRPADLDEEQKAYLESYMHREVLPFLSPQIINARHPFPHLENGALYVVVRLDEHAGPTKKAKKKAKAEAEAKGEKTDAPTKEERADAKRIANNLGAEGVTLGIIPMPRHGERVIVMPGKDKGVSFVLLEHALEMFAEEIFSMYKVKHTNVICVTRNADLDATEGADELGEDYREHMKRILKKRSRLTPVRLESERPLSDTIKPLLLDKLGLKEHQLYVTSVPLDMGYSWGLGSLVSTKKRAALTPTPFTPHWPACLERNRSIMEQVTEKDVLLSYPYQSMDAFVQLLREAATDPAVISIKITLYRLASQSHLAEALIAAAEAGKEVTALFELRARFDESNNIEWSQRFEQAGCHVIYGFRNYKVHSKICTITRQTPQGLQHITQLGTGNYNEKTAKLYTDFSFITSDPTFGRDAAEFFRNMALENISDNYDILQVAPLQIKQQILEGIDEQISRAQQGLPSGLMFKTNSITDREVIERISDASKAGVPTTLFVRGISCLIPGVEGFTDNVRVVSIVGRLLEHSRIYCFGPREDCRVYLSSADLMTRNLNKRIEIAWPILGDELREQVLGYLDLCMADTAKLRELLPDGSYTPLGMFAAHEPAGEVVLFDSQDYLIGEAQRQHLAAAELNARRDANRVGPGRSIEAAHRTEEEAEFTLIPGAEEQAAASAFETAADEMASVQAENQAKQRGGMTAEEEAAAAPSLPVEPSREASVGTEAAPAAPKTQKAEAPVQPKIPSAAAPLAQPENPAPAAPKVKPAPAAPKATPTSVQEPTEPAEEPTTVSATIVPPVVAGTTPLPDAPVPAQVTISPQAAKKMAAIEAARQQAVQEKGAAPAPKPPAPGALLLGAVASLFKKRR